MVRSTVLLMSVMAILGQSRFAAQPVSGPADAQLRAKLEKKPGQSRFLSGNAGQITFAGGVGQLIYERCAPCHHSGGLAPFSLTSYDDARRRAAQIANVTRRRYMPPWPPEPGVGDFANDRHLTSDQISAIDQWAKAGAPRGDAAREPKPPAFPSGWQLGQPDLIVSMPTPFRLPASGPDLFRNFIVPSGLGSTRYVKGFEIRLDTPRAVHHANVVLDRTRSLRRRDGLDGQPGFAGMDVVTEAAPNDFDPDSHFLFWKPATALRFEPSYLAWRLDAGTDLVLNLHLQPTGKEEIINAQIGLYFTDRAPRQFPMLIQLENDGALRIPPGRRDFEVTDRLTLPVGVDVIAIYPHAHYLGKTIDAIATLPGGRRLPLIRISSWDINWQATYEFRQPIRLPKGTEVSMRISYDNSENNPRNPNHPPELVLTGDRSQDEMGHVWLQVLPVTNGDEDGRWALQEAVMRRRLAKYPGDFLAEYNLGAFFQSRGRLDEALSAYQKAVAANPSSAAAHNGAGAVLLAKEALGPATDEFRSALKVDAHYTSARYNLGRALALSGSLLEAREEYSQLLRENPEDAEAQSALGTLNFRLNQYPEAIEHLREAARLDPANADVQANLGTVLAVSGELPAAVRAFERALEINPNQQAARQNLARARSAISAAHP